MRRRTRREGSHTRPPMTADVLMCDEVRAGDTDAMRDRRIGRSTDRASGHHGTIPMPRPDQMPMPTMAHADSAAERSPEYRPITRP